MRQLVGPEKATSSEDATTRRSGEGNFVGGRNSTVGKPITITGDGEEKPWADAKTRLPLRLKEE